jgi:hypothetical protein
MFVLDFLLECEEKVHLHSNCHIDQTTRGNRAVVVYIPFLFSFAHRLVVGVRVCTSFFF